MIISDDGGHEGPGVEQEKAIIRVWNWTVMTGRHWYSAHYDPTVKDSPHPQASLILGFLNANFALQKCAMCQREGK